MAISYYLAAWLHQLCGSKLSMDGASLVEIGPQDIAISPEVMKIIASRRLGFLRLSPTMKRIYYGSDAKPDAQAAFYSVFGVRTYSSIDRYDKRADYPYDMNSPVPVPERFDVVTNFGTAEHVFNVFQFFDNVHRLLKPGGVALHVLPTFGDLNHGFYNFHPIFFRRLAEANGYEIVDFRYVDNLAYKTFMLDNKDPDAPFGYDQIYTDNIGEYDAPRVSAYRRFLQNAQAPETIQCEPTRCFTVFDYNFVALRKVSDAPFKAPSQEKSKEDLGIAPRSYIVEPPLTIRQRVIRSLPAVIRDNLVHPIAVRLKSKRG